jgi:hypothetical protein
MTSGMLALLDKWRKRTFPPSIDDVTWRHEHLDGRLSVIEGKLDGYNLDARLDKHFERHYVTYYRKSKTSLLNSLCDRYGSDKGEIKTGGHPYPWRSHSYADFYERQFGMQRKYMRNVFECGLGTNNPALESTMGAEGRPGASLRIWRDYFPSANIYGADIDKEILFEEERISTFFCDQTDPVSIGRLWSNMPGIEFEIMIDDGLHTFDAGRCLFENSFHKLTDNGIYIIEDVKRDDLEKFQIYLTQKAVNFEFICLYRDGLPLGSNSLIVIRQQ